MRTNKYGGMFMADVDLKMLGERIKKAREQQNISQYTLAKKIDMSTTQLSAYENGKKSIGLQVVARIASALNMTIDELYYGPESMHPITKSTSKGELIVNCVVALFDERVIYPSYIQGNDIFGGCYNADYSSIFSNYSDILTDMVDKLYDLEQQQDDYEDPNNIREQIIAAAAKKINNCTKD